MRSPEVKIYLFLFSPKCTFLYTFIFFSNYAYEAINETPIFKKYRFKALSKTLVFYNRCIFKESIGVQTRGSQRFYLFLFSTKCTFLNTFMFFSNCAYGAVDETHIFAKYRFRALFYILVFPNWPIFKEFIWGQTRGSKRSKRGQST